MPAEVHDNPFPLLHHAIERTRFTRLHELTTGHPLIQPHLHHSVTTANSAYQDLFADRPSTQSSDLRFLSIPLRSCARKQAGSYKTHKYVVLWKSKMQHKSAFSRVKSLPRSSPFIKKTTTKEAGIKCHNNTIFPTEDASFQSLNFATEYRLYTTLPATQAHSSNYASYSSIHFEKLSYYSNSLPLFSSGAQGDPQSHGYMLSFPWERRSPLAVAPGVRSSPSRMSHVAKNSC